jgi:fluoride ion exporter CrcB/FEX
MIMLVLGAAAGGILRFWSEYFFNYKFGKHHFVGTLFANVVGSFLLGFLAGRGFGPNEVWVLQFGLAFTGTFTTFGGFIAQSLSAATSSVDSSGLSVSKIHWTYLLVTVGFSMVAAFVGLTWGL